MRSALSEALGTALLLAVVVGSGIMGERLAGGNDAIALLVNALATGCGLYALIVAFADRSGAHFNPLVSVALVLRAGFPPKRLFSYLPAQFIGAVAGVLVAHLMFDLPLLQASQKARFGVGQWCSEVVATFGLVFLVLSLDPKRPWAAPAAVGAYITAAYWFTASTSFANPAVTVARAMTDTFAGISPAQVGPFIASQAIGAVLAMLADRCLRPANRHGA